MQDKDLPDFLSTSEEPTVVVTETQNRSWWGRRARWQKFSIVFSIFLLFFLALGSVLAWHTYNQDQALRLQVAQSEITARTAYGNFKTQNLPAVDGNIQELKTQLDGIDATYSNLSIYGKIPIAKTYYEDGLHGLAAARAGLAAGEKSIQAIVPYADVLGFSGEGTFTGGTTEDRLKVILETLEKISPSLDAISSDLDTMKNELAQIDENQYPEQVQGKPIRGYVVQAKQLSEGASAAVTDYRPVLEQLPKVAGSGNNRQKYLVLFQNDNELRPTGGFLTAYAVITVENGKVAAEKSDDIYELDKKFNGRLPIPPELGKYLTTERYWNLRDQNIDPDFKNSMTTFYGNYEKVPGEFKDINGIIAIDTHFLVNLMKTLGPVEVPGYGTFSAENDASCDCPQIIHALSEIITRPTPYLRENRKGILGPLMRSLLTKAYGAPKQQWPSLFETGFKSVQARHIQMYFFDEEAQQAAELAQAAGRLERKNPDSDFFALINANLGGAKSNLFVTYDVKQVVSAPENGKITKTVEITYKNPRKADNCNLEAGLLCLNSTLRDWTRIYVPKGAELQDGQGFTAAPQVYESGEFSVIDGFFTLEPLGTAKLKVTYTIPYTNAETYTLDVWKQGGIENYEMLMDVTGGEEQVNVTKDTTYSTKF